VKALRVVVLLGAALVLQSLMSRWVGASRLRIDLPLVAVVYAALVHGRVAGLLGGTLAGLAQDAVSGGIVGVGGLSKTVAGFVAGVVGTQFIVTQTWARLLVFTGATAVNAVLFSGVYALLGLRRFDQPYVAITLEAACNGLVGLLAFEIVEFVPGARERWRARRSHRQRGRYR
jgi:rod shape-determining protein MreD